MEHQTTLSRAHIAFLFSCLLIEAYPSPLYAKDTIVNWQMSPNGRWVAFNESTESSECCVFDAPSFGGYLLIKHRSAPDDTGLKIDFKESIHDLFIRWDTDSDLIIYWHDVEVKGPTYFDDIRIKYIRYDENYGKNQKSLPMLVQPGEAVSKFRKEKPKPPLCEYSLFFFVDTPGSKRAQTGLRLSAPSGSCGMSGRCNYIDVSFVYRARGTSRSLLTAATIGGMRPASSKPVAGLTSVLEGRFLGERAQAVLRDAHGNDLTVGYYLDFATQPIELKFAAGDAAQLKAFDDCVDLKQLPSPH